MFENLEISFPRGRAVFGALLLEATPEVVERVATSPRRSSSKTSSIVARSTLSHGQKQWLEIGMLLIQDPELLMLDEPVAGMSVSERSKTAELLSSICPRTAR